LGIALIVVNKEATDQQRAATDSIAVASNKVVNLSKQRDDLLMVNQTLESNLVGARSEFSNKLAATEASLHAAEASAAEAQAAAKAQADSNAVVLAQRNQQLAELESQNQAMDREAANLRVALTNIETKIAETQGKLARSEGDRTFLLQQLKTLQAEKAEMEERFNNIADVREQLRKLKIEASLTRRIDRERRGIEETFAEKGETLAHKPVPSSSENGAGAGVELRPGGSVKIQLPQATNAPPQ